MNAQVKLSINNLHFYSYHGVSSAEQQLGGRYEIDVELYYNAQDAIISDDLSRAVNYADIMSCIGDVVQQRRRRLIETLAYDIAAEILARFSAVEAVCLRVRKRNVPAGMVVDSVEVEWKAQRPR